MCLGRQIGFADDLQGAADLKNFGCTALYLLIGVDWFERFEGNLSVGVYDDFVYIVGSENGICIHLFGVEVISSCYKRRSFLP